MFEILCRYLATGDSMQTIAFSYQVGHSTVCGIIKETCIAIWNALKPVYLKAPSNEQQWKRITRDFEHQWNFPNCIGAIDGKHVVIQAPANSGSEYYNYKGTFSIVLLAACDANYCFTFVDIGDNGRHCDAGVLANSTFGQALEHDALFIPSPTEIPGCPVPVPYSFVADEAFPLRHYMMRPYPGRHLDDEKRIFNYRLSRARRTIENAFGILAARWRIYRRSIQASPDKVTEIVKATCCLHNYLTLDESTTSINSRRYCPITFLDYEDRHGNVIPGDWRSIDVCGLQPVSRVSTNTYTASAANIRNGMRTYFQSPEGKLPWQDSVLH